VASADLAATLCASAPGLKLAHGPRQGFVDGLRIAVRALCPPLGVRS
jgi:hypothetical protein